MSSSSRRLSDGAIAGFVAGILTASVAFCAHRELTKRRRRSSAPGTTCSRASKVVADDMDSPDLPLRMIRKAETVIQRRTSRVIVVVERCTNEHNHSAILRTAEALGVQGVWIVDYRGGDVVDNGEHNDKDGDEHNRVVSKNGKVIALTEEERRIRNDHHLFARRAAQWLDVREFDDAASCLAALREDGRTVWVTDLGQEAVCMTREGLVGDGNDDGGGVVPERLALVFGTEAVGCSRAMLEAADRRVYLPLHGFADSLNLSVAAALCLLQVFHLDPTIVGAMSDGERALLREDWYVRLASQRLTTSAEKKRRGRLAVRLKKVEEIEARRRRKEDDADNDEPPLTTEQLKKLEDLPALRAELAALDDEVRAKAAESVRHFLEDPPPPLADMRRSDEHRTCFVGKNTRAKYADEWRDMPATDNVVSAKGATASYFREVKADDSQRRRDKSNREENGTSES